MTSDSSLETKKNKAIQKKKYEHLLAQVNLIDSFPSFLCYEHIPTQFSCELIFKHSKEINETERLFAFSLCKTNMELMYNEANFNGGWKDKTKRKELKHPDGRFIFVKDKNTDELVGFLLFRVIWDGGNEPVLFYVWEIQLVSKVLRKGLGKFLMTLGELIARKFACDKIMLTVLKKNLGVISFYKSLHFLVDETDPNHEEEVSYVILSKSCLPYHT